MLSFIKLGMRVFEFLSPTAVIGTLASDITTAVNAVAATGLLARDRSIQAHHQRVAAVSSMRGRRWYLCRSVGRRARQTSR